jgi:hypothetical protein
VMIFRNTLSGMSPSIFPPCKRATMPSSKARVLFELTRLVTGSQWGATSCFSPSDEATYLIVDSNSCLLVAWGFLSVAYRVALPMSGVVTNTLFSVLLGILVHSAGCITNVILDRDFGPKVGTFQVAMTVTGLLTPIYME